MKCTFELLRNHSLLAKRSKCDFACRYVEYMGHCISKDGVSTDPKKIATIQNWPTPKTIMELKGFLGLTGYYKRFLKNYGTINRPLTTLLKKNQFHWSEYADSTFKALKIAMVTPPVLALPDFQKEFVIEIDASNNGSGVVVMQKGHPLAFISKALSPKHQSLSAYENELFAIVYAVGKWHHYLFGKHFVIRTDHNSLKFLLQ